MGQPRISQLRTWERYEQRILAALTSGLILLTTKTDLSREEVKLNRDLLLCLWQICHRNPLLDLPGLSNTPLSEAKNPPHADDHQRATDEDKVPDFIWAWHDDAEDDWSLATHHYRIECKRLGKATSSDWVLNRNYIHHGIQRFLTQQHGYAKGERSGAMVGYVQDMDFDSILVEVNSEAVSAAIPILTSREEWHDRGVTHLEHQLPHPFLPNTSFSLRHLWVDIRQCYPPL